MKKARSPEEQAVHLAACREQVERLFNTYPTRHLRNPEKAMVEYVTALSAFRVDDLEKGITRAIRFETDPFLPVPGCVREHVSVVVREREEWEARRERLRGMA